MLEAAKAANDYVAPMTALAELRSDRKSRHAVLYNLFVLGEAAKGVSEPIRAQHPQLEWRSIAGLRDILAHEYFGIDEEIIWDVAKNKLPGLISQLEGILARDT
jgi:uncharacterized protein with HEPN domain